MAGSKGGVEEITSNQKIDMYRDPRENTTDMPVTIITCLNFIEAVEDDKYGFRWECPMGGVKCKYRHMLPEGYVMTTKKEREAAKKQAELDKDNAKTLEEEIEEERAALRSDDLTPVTKESFFAWKERRKKQKQDVVEEELKKAQEDKAFKKAAQKGKNSIMNGRALFTYNPDLFKEPEMEEKKVLPKEEEKIDSNLFANEEVDEDEVDFD